MSGWDRQVRGGPPLVKGKHGLFLGQSTAVSMAPSIVPV